MIAIILTILALLAMWHFAIEAIVAPAERAIIRLKLFAVRDRLRRMAADGLTREAEFEEAQLKINTLIRLVPIIDPFMIIEWSFKLRVDKELAEKIEQRQNAFEEIASKEVKDLVFSANKITLSAVKVNSLSWYVYIIPLAVIAPAVSWIRKRLIQLSNARDRELPASAACPI